MDRKDVEVMTCCCKGNEDGNVKHKPAVPNLPVITDIPTSVSRSFLYTKFPNALIYYRS